MSRVSSPRRNAESTPGSPVSFQRLQELAECAAAATAGSPESTSAPHTPHKSGDETVADVVAHIHGRRFARAYEAAQRLLKRYSSTSTITTPPVSPAETRTWYELHAYSALAAALVGMHKEAHAVLQELGPAVAQADAHDVPFLLRYLMAAVPLLVDPRAQPAALYELYWFCERQRASTRPLDTPPPPTLEAAQTTAAAAAGATDEAEWDRREALVLNAVAARHMSLGQAQQAVMVLERVVALRPTDPAALTSLGRAYYALGCPDECRAVLAEAGRHMDAAHSARHCVWDAQNRALPLLADEQYGEATECLQDAQLKVAALAGGAQDPALTNNIGACFMYRGQLAQALGVFSQAAAVQPGAVTDAMRNNLFILYDLTSEHPEELKKKLLAQIQKNKAPH